MNQDGTFEEIYNGPGHLIQAQLAGHPPTLTGLACRDDGYAQTRQCSRGVERPDSVALRTSEGMRYVAND